MTAYGNITWSPGMTLEELERMVITKAYAFYRQNKTTTAQALGISVRTLDNKFVKYEEDDAQQEIAIEERRRNQRDFLARSRGEPVVQHDTSITQNRAEVDVSGLHHKSVFGLSSEQPVSVPERAEVQKVLPPRHAATSSKGRGR